MCGIIGQFNQAEKISESLFNEMRDSMIHRGPDGFGTELFEDGKCAFGHRRLSIIELSDLGKQPMSNIDKDIWITFNGEIYNYKELRKELKSRGTTFQSHSDTEVILLGYKEWGIKELLYKLKGMFAFSIWDCNKQKMFLGRDRFGIKPLYYRHTKDQFLFGSDLKSLLIENPKNKVLDKDSIADFFIYSYIPGEQTIWQGYRKLLPAHYLEFDYNKNQISKKCYWKLKIKNKKVKFKKAVADTNTLLKNSVKEHLESDVPVGLFLSGGYDSTIMLKYLKEFNSKVNTFSIGFENSDRSEHLVARKIANHYNTNHHELILKENKNYAKDLEEMSSYYDEPFAVSSMLPYYLISKFAATKNKVVIVGDGGDEAFGGYRWYKTLNDYYTNIPVKRKVKQLIKGKKEVFLSIYNKAMTGVYGREPHLDFINEDIKKRIFDRELWYFNLFYKKDLNAIKQAQYIDVHSFLSDHALSRADKSSMASSIEVRVPFLDHKIYEYTFGLNTDVYYHKGKKKTLLEENLKNNVPQEVLDMPKYGFSFQLLEKLFDADFESFVLNGELVKNKIIKKNISIVNLNDVTKFHLLMLELWLKNNL